MSTPENSWLELRELQRSSMISCSCPGLTDAKRNGALVLQAVIAKNSKFSPEKFLISPQVTFSSLSLSATSSVDVAILQDKERMSGFINLKTPSSIKEKLFGLLATFHKGLPGIARETINLRKLVQKGVRFS